MAKAGLGCELDECLTSQTLNVETGSWLPISGTALISGISAALVGSMFSSVAWEIATLTD
jgi:APA family basic amino acid/polyamine antiporter